MIGERDTDNYLTVTEAAAQLQRTPSLVYHYIRTKRGTDEWLPAQKVDVGVGRGRYLISRSDFERWKERIWVRIRRAGRA